MRGNTRSFLMISALALANGTLAQPAPKESQQAGAGSDQSARGIEEVIVSAQRKDESIQDVPISMSSFTGDQLKDAGVVDTTDLAKKVPGFTFADSGFNVPIYTLRGVGFNGNSQTSTGTVGLYVDEFNLPFPVMTKGPTLDVKRVEVLKGPQGTLFGQNTTSGLINSITNKPTPTFEAGVNASYGRFDTSDVEAFVSGPVLDTLGFRLAIRDIQSGEGWQKSLTRPNGPDGELGVVDKQSGRLTMDWTPLQSLEITAAVEAWSDQGDVQAPQALEIVASNNEGDATLSPAVRGHPTVPKDSDDMRLADWVPPNPGNIAVPFELDEKVDDSFRTGRLRLDWSVPDWGILQGATLSYLGSYGEFKAEDTQLNISGLSVPNLDGKLDAKTSYWNHELRVAASWGTKIDYQFGFNLSQSEADDVSTFIVTTLSAAFPHDSDGNSLLLDDIRVQGTVDAEAEGVFANVDWWVLPSLKLNVGGRYTETSHDLKEACVSEPGEEQRGGFTDAANLLSISQGGSGGAQPGDCTIFDEETRNLGPVSKSLDEDNVAARVSLDWTPLDDYLFFLSRTRGFKSGGFSRINATEEKQLNPVNQEQLDAWEIGAKTSFLNKTLQVNVAFFYYDYQDKQLFTFFVDPIFGALNKLDNIPESEVKGGELEVRATPIQNFDIVLSAAHVDSKIEKFVGTNSQGEEQDLAGNQFTFAPRWEYSASLNYRWPLPWPNGLELGVGVDFSYTDESFGTLDNKPAFELRDSHNVDYRLSLGHTDRSWNFAFWGRNVTNQLQPVSIVSGGGADTIARFVRKPQTYGVTLEYNYR